MTSMYERTHEYEVLYQRFHALWSKQPERGQWYDKQDWKNLDAAMHRALKAAEMAPNMILPDMAEAMPRPKRKPSPPTAWARINAPKV